MPFSKMRAGKGSSGAAHSRIFPRVVHDPGAGHGGGAVKRREVVENVNKEWK